jgi:pimeloyl-ACP methyl ester carboxylesterase
MFKFVSGWAGYPELFPVISSEYSFYLPFIKYSEEEIVSELASGGEILAGWSTGAHIILKNLEALLDQYDQIFLFAPFICFTEYVHAKVVMTMLKKMKKVPETVLEDFYEKSGVTGRLPKFREKDVKSLVSGLEYLMRSCVEVRGLEVKDKVVIAQGYNDMVINFRASEDVAEILNGEKLITIECGHFFPEEKISEIIYENTRKKIL